VGPVGDGAVAEARRERVRRIDHGDYALCEVSRECRTLSMPREDRVQLGCGILDALLPIAVG
jgi:hypothetical protein